MGGVGLSLCNEITPKSNICINNFCKTLTNCQAHRKSELNFGVSADELPPWDWSDRTFLLETILVFVTATVSHP